MPVARYFFFVGGILLVLLFLVDAGSPKLPVADAGTAAMDPGQRIRSDQKWPERIVFETSLPTIVPAAPVNVEAPVPAPSTTAEFPAKARVRETFAQFRPGDEKKPEVKLPPKRKVVRNRVAPPMVLAQQPRFGFFDTTW